jgi:N-acyl-D-aspartate/D-glutamate deacylase
MSDFDLVIRGGTLYDGSGGEPKQADIGINGALIAAVGEGLRGKEEIDAAGLMVTPGFVDAHTHYDGQITWENRLSPSSDHGVTTVVMGNCAVGFAPCRPEHRDMLIQVMSGVEDIPEVVMADGVPWEWETFPEYLDFLDTREADIDFATQIPHAAVRVYVMGKRGADREMAQMPDLVEMTRIVKEGIEAGAIGVSSSRTMAHRTSTGQLAPTETSGDAELLALARGVRQAGGGVMEVMTDFNDVQLGGMAEFETLRRLARDGGCPVSFTLVQVPQDENGWKRVLELTEEARAEGLALTGQVAPRAVGMCYGLDLSFNPFTYCDTYRTLADLPLDERVAKLRDPEIRAKILSEEPKDTNHTMVWLSGMFEQMFPMDETFSYEPDPQHSIGARAKARGIDARELAYDTLLEADGHRILYLPITNFADGSLSVVRKMMESEATMISLGDGGAHYGLICDASYSTFALTFWGRDRKEGRFPLAHLVNELTRKPALLVGLDDRGMIAPGMKADINVIDFDKLTLHLPEVRYDLPGGARRMIQRVDGYVATIVSGKVTYRNGEPTGELPGRLVRRRREEQRQVA